MAVLCSVFLFELVLPEHKAFLAEGEMEITDDNDATEESQPSIVQFSDIADSPYKDSINSLAQKGIIQGYDNGEFRPLQRINRAELLKIVFKTLDQNAHGYVTGCFPDVADEWFAPYVCKAKGLGIVAGYPDGFYRPGQSVNMVEALKIAINAFAFPINELDEDDKWFTPYADFAHINNLFSKYDYLPDRPSRREEMAFLVDELLKIQKEERELAIERSVASFGCGLESQPLSPLNKFMVRGVERSTITIIPDEYDQDEPIALVFAFHGRTNSNQMVRGYYDVEQASDGKAIFVYPAGMPAPGGYNWADGGDSPGKLRDYEFFDVMLEEFLNSYCINVDKVYVVGHSLGGWFTNSLACARGDKIRAVASLGGSRSNSNCTGPVAVMQWHNPNDQQASYAGAVLARDAFIAQNQCSTETVSVDPSWGNCIEYQECHESSPVIFCPHNLDYDYRGDYYPHNWPRGTGEEMWEFFEGLEE